MDNRKKKRITRKKINGTRKQLTGKKINGVRKQITRKKINGIRKRITRNKIRKKKINDSNRWIAKEIKVFGMVQGVGFRPLIYHMAKKWDIQGYVRNIGDYVEILARAKTQQLESFQKEIEDLPKEGFEIIEIKIEQVTDFIARANGREEESENNERMDFIILESKERDDVTVIPPDLSICPSCQKELEQNSNRRWKNAFISCTSCGPRYTIIESMPYDRPTTTMKNFDMCPNCLTEYTSKKDRRFHAQTISCNDCGPYLIYRGRNYGMREEIEEHYCEEAMMEAFRRLKAGGILAVKGIGGYHFVCSPFREKTVQRLRRLKGREKKPFAVMFDSLETIKRHCLVSEEEGRLLESKARPIVLLQMNYNDMAPSTNQRSLYCGAFLPYTPLQVLLTKQCGPLIMTSANISDQAIIREDEIILSLDTKELDGVLYHKRRIVRSVDDSVGKVIDGKPQLLRRSRGYTPYPILLKNTSDKTEEYTIFAAGGDLKAAFCLLHHNQAIMSQHFGDLESISVNKEYNKSYEDLTSLLRLNPTLAVCDLHPNYLSTRFARKLNLPVWEVQHHHAHIASVMAEHGLQGKVLGVAFDGTGYGTDGNIWGGEFLVCEKATYIRAAHLKNIRLLGGDGSVKDALKTATCYLINCGLEEYIQDERKDVIKAAIEYGINNIESSSMGRLFDAVASILGVGQYNQYEGECAVLLEQEAILAERSGSLATRMEFDLIEKEDVIEVDASPVLQAICQSRGEKELAALALGFHNAVAQVIARVSNRLRERYHFKQIALSGGVFQNTLLVEKTVALLREDGFEVYLNRLVPPNDGGISLGQAYLGKEYLINKASKSI